jgi:branched-chain amino acid transport system substrate-binding protein
MRSKMANGKGVGTAILGVALAALLLVTACAPAPTTVGAKTVETAAILPVTGAAAESVQMMLFGTEDYLRYFNEQEGIPGVTIELLWGDTAMQTSQFYSLYEKFSSRGVPVMRAIDVIPLDGLKQRFAKDGVVMFGDATGYQAMIYSPGWRYFESPTPAERFAVVAEHFMENWKEERAPRLAFVGIQSLWADDPQPLGKEYARSLGFEILPSEMVPHVVLDATANLLRLKDEGADFVYMQTIPSSLGPVLRDAERLGLLGQIHFGGTQTGMSEKVIEMTGAASEGFLYSMIAPWFDETEVPGIRLMIDKQMEYRGKVFRDTTYENGWIETAVQCEAIRRAIGSVGYDNLDGAAIKEALDNMKDFDVNGLASVTYRPLDHRGITKLAICEIKGGKIVRMSNWREVPSLVPEGLVRE